MCGCPTHIVETASQLANVAGTYGPLISLIPAALMGGKFGKWLLRLVAKVRFAGGN